MREIADQLLTVAAVAARLGVTRQGVQRTADALVADGLARWSDNPRHRRAKLLAPTATGRRVLRTAHQAHIAWVEQASTLLPADLPVLTVQLRAWLRGAGLVPERFVVVQGSQLGAAGEVHVHDDGRTSG